LIALNLVFLCYHAVVNNPSLAVVSAVGVIVPFFVLVRSI